MMASYHREFPDYGWNKNKGYPTAYHRKAIALLGITPLHRKSFRLTDSQLRLWY
jgi:ribonuclease HII